MAGKRYGFREKVPDRDAYTFMDGRTRVYCVEEFATVVKDVLSRESLMEEVKTGNPEKWVVLQGSSKQERFRSLREDLEEGKITADDIKKKVLQALFSWRWCFQETRHEIGKCKAAFRWRLAIVIVIGVALVATKTWFLCLAVSAMLAMFLFAYFLCSLTRFKVEISVEKARYDSVKLAINLFIVAIAALLGLTAAFGELGHWPTVWLIVSCGLGIWAGAWASQVIVNISSESQSQIKINEAVWKFVSLLAWFEVLFLLIGLSVVIWQIALN